MRCLSPYSLIPASGHVSGIKYLNAKSKIFPVESFRRTTCRLSSVGKCVAAFMSLWVTWGCLAGKGPYCDYIHLLFGYLYILRSQRLSELCDVVWLLFPSCLTSSRSCKVELLTLYMQLFYVTFKKTVFLLHKSFPIKPSHLNANSVLPKNTVVVTCRQTCNWWRTACL